MNHEQSRSHEDSSSLLTAATGIDDREDAEFFASLPTAAPKTASGPQLPHFLRQVITGIVAVTIAAVVLVSVLLTFHSSGANDRKPAVSSHSDSPIDTVASKPKPSAVESDSDAVAATDSLQRAGGSEPPGAAAVAIDTRRRPIASSPPPPTSTPTDGDQGAPDNVAPGPREEPRYAALPPDATQAITALRTLRASVDLGISFDHYRDKLQELLPAVRLFLESQEAESFPELKTLLSNASDCYIEVRNIWNESIYSSLPLTKLTSLRLLEMARPSLWEIAGTNVTFAYDLASRDAATRATTLQRFAESPDTLRMAPALQAAKAKLAADVAPPPQDSPPAAASRLSRPAVALSPAFRSHTIEVAQVRQMAEILSSQELSKDDAALVDDVLSLTRPREWVTRKGDKAWGTLVTIWPDHARFDTKKGDSRIPREWLSAASAKVVDRIAVLAESLHALNNRLSTAPDPE